MYNNTIIKCYNNETYFIIHINFSYIFYRYNKNRLFNRIIIIKKSCFCNCSGLLVKIFLFYALQKLPSSSDESQCVRLIKSYFCRDKKLDQRRIFLLLRSDHRHLIKCTSPITKLHHATTDSLQRICGKKIIRCNFMLYHKTDYVLKQFPFYIKFF